MKKEPKAVYIIENGGYTELTYEEFRRREQICPLYADKLFLPLYGRLMEVSKEDYTEFYRAKRRQKYLDERSADNGDFSYADEGITGTSMEKRDDFRRMLRDCKKGLIDRIIVKSMSRFARNTEEMLTALRALEQMEVSVYFEEQGLDTKSMNSEMFATFPGMVAQQESVSISQNMRWSYKKRMESGEFNCCAPAYGFDLINGKLVINETEAAVIRRIFDLYLQGIGMQTIANILNDEGVRRQYGREKWHHTTVNYILNNERYKGDALLQKQITTQTLPFKKQRNHGEQPMYYVENSNPAIVSRETYEAVQALIKNRQPSCKRKAKNYPLTRTLLCPDCGHTFRRQVVNGTAYWLCAAKATNKTDCVWRRVKEDEVYAAFNLMIRKVQANREYLLGTLIRQLEELQYRTTGSQQRIKEIDREIADLTAQNLVLSRLHGKGVLNAADYTAQSDVLENKITELRIERRAKITDSDENEMLEELKMLNDILKEVEIGIDFDAELFEQTVDSITVDSNELLTFHLAGGISLPEKIREKGRCYQA